MNSHSQQQMVQQKCQEETTDSENPHRGGKEPQGAKIAVENFEVNRESRNRQKQKMTLKPVPTSGRFKVTSFIAITLNHEFNSMCRKEETFPIPLEYIDVTRSTHTDLFWNVDLNRSLSDSWKGFTKFTLLKEKPPKGYIWSVERLTKVQTTARPDYVWPKVWTKIGKAAQNREKHEWAREKPKFDNARRLRGIYFIDPDYQDYKETLKNVMRKLEILWQQPCRARGKLKQAPRRWRGRWGFQGTRQTREGPNLRGHLRLQLHSLNLRLQAQLWRWRHNRPSGCQRCSYRIIIHVFLILHTDRASCGHHIVRAIKTLSDSHLVFQSFKMATFSDVGCFHAARGTCRRRCSPVDLRVREGS